jgi:broad specificity phosphatase PhoE
MRLLLVRHGETDTNRDGLGLGRGDPPLNAAGERQAAAAARRLLAWGEVAAVYTSPLLRARQTAERIAATLGVALAEPLDALAEMDVGEFEGLTAAEMRERAPAFFSLWRGDSAGEARMPGGESLAEVEERAWSAVKELLGRHAGETVALVSHNFTLRTIVCRALDVPLADFRRFRQDLASISAIDFAPRLRVVLLNETCHLNGLADR